MSQQFFATTAKGMEDLLAAELRALGAATVEPTRAGCSFAGTLEIAYRACLHLRTANRVLLPLATFPAPDGDALYAGVRSIPWREHLGEGRTIAVDYTASRSQLDHTHYGALRTKDAIVDQLREETGARPSVDTAQPDLRINVHVAADVATLSLDLSGDSLHKRGYREGAAPAPLKENLAAAILLAAGWQELAPLGVPFLDPMCGSGTLPIEAALIAMRRAPGLARSRWGFAGWLGHDAALWERILDEARAAEVQGAELARLPAIVGYDEDPRAIRAALGNVERAGLRGRVHIEKRAFASSEPLPTPPHLDESAPRGFFIVNPPYGERLGEQAELEPLYQLIGDTLRHHYSGWFAAVFTGNPALASHISLRAAKRQVFWNGAIECRLLTYPISRERVVGDEGPRWRAERSRPSPGAEMFTNRIAKNLKHLRKWAKREGITCYRVYDGDLPEYAVAVDLYEGAAHVQEYQAPKTVDPEKAEMRWRDVKLVLPEALGIPPERVYFKVRRRQHGDSQYEKLDDEGTLLEVRERDYRFVVNLSDHLDSGLFLDDRDMRALIGELARGRSFLNLFAYTGTATVYAARGGATSTTTVDLSNTYLDIAERNFRLNGVPVENHRIVRADCLRWIEDEIAGRTAHGYAHGRDPRPQYGLIFVAPPTFSNSKAMDGTFDVQRDHVRLLTDLAELLAPGGILLFENNLRRFKLDEEALSMYVAENITARTLPEDFARNPRIHNAWRLTLR